MNWLPPTHLEFEQEEKTATIVITTANSVRAQATLIK